MTAAVVLVLKLKAVSATMAAFDLGLDLAPCSSY